jgi:alkanesulfonate monooxygenase SsuD/methylene tetrahydromethanopterin reductase-like flavin-dependent oxidoreductase (luciferase family)
MTSAKLRFGAFIAPFHSLDENPTLAIERDLDLVQLMDRLGYDEAWIGEHHSAGFEIIASRRCSSPPPLSEPSTSALAPASPPCPITIH